MKYRVADNIFEIRDTYGSRAWQRLAWHYEPFQVEEGEPLFELSLFVGRLEVRSDFELVFEDKNTSKTDVKMDVYKNRQGDSLFVLTQPGDSAPNAWLMINSERNQADTYVDELAENVSVFKITNAITNVIQIAFMLAVYRTGTLITHTSCVVNSGRAFLFQGKSGTGKSTHARLWVENIAGSELLNDDHPVLRIGADGNVTVYGSPWSGKTDCYRNLSAPLGAMVRITRAPINAIRNLSPIEAYASVTPTIFGVPFDEGLADIRHSLIEKVICSTPCYDLKCLPDADAARCSSSELLK